MLMAKIVDNKIVEFIDTDKPEDYPDFVEVPEHVPSNADVRFFHEDWTPKTEQELLDEGLIEPEPEPEPEPEEPEPTAEEKARWKRDGLLRELDAIVSNPLRWAEFDEPTKQALADYRQALLDVPQQEGFPDDIDWPVNPLGGDDVD